MNKIPDPDKSPVVLAARAALAQAAAARTAAVRAKRQVEAKYALAEGSDNPDVHYRLRLRADGPALAAHICDLRKQARAAEQAVTDATDALRRAQQQARRELAPKVRSEVIDPAVKAAGIKALSLISDVLRVAELYGAVQAAGLNEYDLHNPFPGTLPCSPNHLSGVADFALTLLRRGHIERTDVPPDLIVLLGL